MLSCCLVWSALRCGLRVFLSCDSHFTQVADIVSISRKLTLALSGRCVTAFDGMAEDRVSQMLTRNTRIHTKLKLSTHA